MSKIDHYENFPVASVLLPAAIRQDVIHIYKFARAADDIADEGDASPAQRQAMLNRFRHALQSAAQTGGKASVADPDLDVIFMPLGQTLAKRQLPVGLLMDLLSAFEQDTKIGRYRDEDMVLDYCRRSANPVGRLLLHLFRQTDTQSLRESDAVCTALQRINFLQDIAIDWRKGRIYLSEQGMAAAGVTEQHIATGCCDQAWTDLMQCEVQKCRDLMQKGSPLGRRLRGRIALEIRLVIAGGLRILEKIEAVKFDVFNHRPTLTKTDWARMVVRAL